MTNNRHRRPHGSSFALAETRDTSFGHLETTISSYSGLRSHGGSSVFETPQRSSHQQEKTLKQRRELLVLNRMLAYREDLADWFSTLFSINVTEKTFIASIEDGVLLCRLALMIDSASGLSDTEKTRGFAVGHGRSAHKTSRNKLRFNGKAEKGSFFARDNVSTFIKWAKDLGVDDSVSFETSDLVEQKNERNVLYTLMEIARVQDVLEPPSLIKLERKIENNALDESSRVNLESAIDKLCAELNTPRSRVVKRRDGDYDVDNRKFTLALLRGRVVVHNGRHWDGLREMLTAPPEDTSRSSRASVASDRRRSRLADGGKSLYNDEDGDAGDEPAGRRLFSKPRGSASNLSSSRSSRGGLGFEVSGSGPEMKRASGENLIVGSERQSTSSLPLPKGTPSKSRLSSTDGDAERKLLEDTISSLEREIKRLKDDLEFERIAKSSADKELTRVQLELKAAMKQLQALPDVDALQTQNDDLARGHDTLNQRLGEYAEAMKELEHSRDDALRAKDAELDDCKNRMSKLRQELDQARASVGGSEEYMNGLEEDLRQARKELKEAKRAHDRAQLELDDQKALAARYQDAQREADSALQRVAELESLVRERHGDNDSMAKQVATLSEQLANARKEDAVQERRISNLQDEVDSKQDQIGHLQQELDAARRDGHGTLERMHAAENELRKLQQDADNDKEELEKSLTTANMEIDVWEKENERLRSLADAATKESEQRLRELNDLVKQANVMQGDLDSERRAGAKLKADLAAAEDALQRATRKHEDAGEEAATLREENIDLKRRLRIAEDEGERNRNRVEKENISISAALDECTDARSSLTARVDALERDLDHARRETDDLHHQVDHLAESNEALEVELSERKHEVDQLGAELSAANKLIADLQAQVSRLTRERDLLQKQAAEHEEKAAEWRGKKKEAEGFLAAAEKNLNAEGRRAQALDDELVRLRAAKMKLEEELQGEKEENGAIAQERDRAIDDMVELGDANERLLKENEELKVDVGDLNTRNELAIQECDSLLEQNRSLNGQCEDAQREIATLKEQIAQLLGERESAQEAKRRAAEEERRRVAEEAALAEARAAEAREKAEEEERRRAEEEEQARLRELEEERLALEQQALMLAELEKDEEFRAMHESLEPLREDLADWLNEILGTNLTKATLLPAMQSGVVLCQLANVIDAHEDDVRVEEAEREEERLQSKRRKSIQMKLRGDGRAVHSSTVPTSSSASMSPQKAGLAGIGGSKAKEEHEFLRLTRHTCPAAFEPHRLKRRWVPRYKYEPPEGQSVLADYIRNRGVRYCPFTPRARPGSATAAHNVQAFIDYCRTLGLVQPDVFRVDDLVKVHDERRVLWGLLDMARRTRRMRVPRIVWLERLPYMARPKPKSDLDAEIRKLVDTNINQPRIKVIRKDENKYCFGEDMSKPLLLRVRANNVLVRVGGGYSSLKEYLQTHFHPDVKMVELQEYYNGIWDEDREAPQTFQCADGKHVMSLQTTRSDGPYY